MRWKITIEGMDEFGGRDTAEMVIEKEFNRLSKGEIDVDGNETSGLRLPDQALPIASFTGWNAAKEKAPGPCTAGAAIPFPPSRAARSLLERYGARSYFAAALRSVADKLVKERLLLPQDADAYVAAGKQSPF